MNVERYPWLKDLNSEEAQKAIAAAKFRFQNTGAVIFPNFVTDQALERCVEDARAQENGAYTTDDVHTAYLKSPDTTQYPQNSVYNHEMRTKVASTAYDELPDNSVLSSLYQNPTLLHLVSSIVGKDLYLSEDPLGCCSINVFRPGYHHSFHFDESEFSTTLMLQEAENLNSGLFQYTDPLRRDSNELVLSKVATVIHQYDDNLKVEGKVLLEQEDESKKQEDLEDNVPPPQQSPTNKLHTLDFRPGTLSVFSGSRSLHRVTRVEGDRSRLVAVLTFATSPGFRNSEQVQRMFWGRSYPPPN